MNPPQARRSLIQKVAGKVLRLPVLSDLAELRAVSRRRKKEMSQWIKQGRPAPPPHSYKEQTVLRYGRAFKAHTLVETGTYTGEMIQRVRSGFKKIVSIEIDESLFRGAQKKFKRIKKVNIMLGDSGKLLPGILDSLPKGPVVFWLDGHFSGGITGKSELDTPIRKELASILASKLDFTLLIDDARFFTGKEDYPSIEELERIVQKRRPDLTFSVRDDIIRIHRPSGEI